MRDDFLKLINNHLIYHIGHGWQKEILITHEGCQEDEEIDGVGLQKGRH